MLPGLALHGSGLCAVGKARCAQGFWDQMAGCCPPGPLPDDYERGSSVRYEKRTLEDAEGQEHWCACA